MISVIIPVFNAEKYFPKCMDSVINQTYANLEIICIDDGSSDNSLKILKSYNDKRIKIISRENLGVSYTRNEGIGLAHGEYIHFMDADDWIDLDYYEKMIAVADDNDMVTSGFVSTGKYTRGIKYKNNFVAHRLYQKLKRTNALVDSYIWRYLFKREFLIKNKLLFRTDLIAQEDTVFLLNAIKCANAVAGAAGVIYHYVENPTSVLNDPMRRARVKQQYKIGKQFRRNFARENDVRWLFVRRKLQKLPLIGELFI